MARPRIKRSIEGNYRCRKQRIHERVCQRPRIVLLKEEVEALRLADLEGLSQAEGGLRMNVSRATFGRILEDARRRIALALVSDLEIEVKGREALASQDGKSVNCMENKRTDFSSKGGNPSKGLLTMTRIAVATNDGKTVASHVGRAKSFSVFKIEGDSAAFESSIANTYTQHFAEEQGRGQGAAKGKGGGSGGLRRGGHGDDHHGGHGGLISRLLSAGCSALVARGMGPRMVEDLNHFGMVPVICGEELVEEAASHFASGNIETGDSACDHGNL